MLERHGIQGKKYDSYALKKKWIDGKVKKEKLKKLVDLFKNDSFDKASLFGEDLEKANEAIIAIEAIETAHKNSDKIIVDEQFISETGEVLLSNLDSIGVAGNNSYYSLQPLSSLDYVSSDNNEMVSKLLELDKS